MSMATLPFGDFKPDLAQHGHDGLIIAENVLPIANGYAPLPAFVADSSGALPLPCLGAASFKSANKSAYMLAGTASGLYRYAHTGWVSVGSGYNASPVYAWRFEQFGNRIIVTNGIDPVQYVPMTDSGVAGRLAGTPPIMQLLTTVRDFLVGGVINNDSLTIQWSGINDSEAWQPGLKQCDYNTFAVGGAVTGVTGGEYGIVLQEMRVTRMSYVGGNNIFQFDELSANVGCVARRSICRFGSQIYFLSHRGFMLCNGAQVTPIGDEIIDRTFLALADMKSTQTMSAVVDPVRKIAVWSVPVSSGTASIWFIYNIILNKWSTAVQPTQFMLSGLSTDYSLEDLDAVSTSIDALPFSLDSAAWIGGVPALYVFNDQNTIGTMSGPPSQATFGLPNIEMITGRSARIRRCRPITDATSGLTLTLAGRQRLGDPVVTTTHAVLQPSGDMPCRRNVRSVKPTLTIAAGTPWTYAQSLQFDVEPGSAR